MLGALAIVVMAAVAGVVLLGCLALFVRGFVWLVFLPIKLVLGLLLLPLLLIKLLLIAIVLPILAIVAAIAVFAVGAAIAIPLAPLIVVAAVVVWLLKKDRPAARIA